MKKKIALIFGVTGQAGSYLSELLINKGYLVHGVKRRSSSFNTARIDHIYQDPFEKKRNFFLHYGDVTDAISVLEFIFCNSFNNLLLLATNFIFFLSNINFVFVSKVD